MNLFCSLLLINSLATLSSFSQRLVSPNNDYTRSETREWPLNKYLWTYSHNNFQQREKPIIDFAALNNWKSIGAEADLSISRDGKYIAYSIKGNAFVNPKRKRDSLVIQGTSNGWRQAFSIASPGFFSADSKHYIFQQDESLCFLKLGSDAQYVKEIISFQQPGNNKGEWLAYLLNDSEHQLIVKDLLSGIEKSFKGVSRYKFDHNGEWLVCQLDNERSELIIHNLKTGKNLHFNNVIDEMFDILGTAMVLKTSEKDSNAITTSLQYVNLVVGKSKTIWSTNDRNINVSEYSFDAEGKQLVFVVEANSSADPRLSVPINYIWYYRAGMKNATLSISNKTSGIDERMLLVGPASFTQNGRYIRFFVQPQQNVNHADPDVAQVDVWAQHDSILQSTQLSSLNTRKVYGAIMKTQGSKVVFIESEYEKEHLLAGDFAIVKRTGKVTHGDRFWEPNYHKDSNWLVSLKDGIRHLLPTKGGSNTFWFSPSGNYLVYFDTERGCNYFCYDLRGGKLTNISEKIPAGQLRTEDPFMLSTQTREDKYHPIGIAGWFQGDGGVLVYDYYDIWKLDLSGGQSPVNVTNGFGRTHKVIFRIMNTAQEQPIDQLILSEKDTVVFRAFDTRNKYDGFFQKGLGFSGDPEKLFMGPCSISGRNGLLRQKVPVKAADAKTWIIKRESISEAPNYFVTNDFKNYAAVTNLQPHKNYNWLKTELHSFKQMDGTLSQGILYKPDNFDSTKKYPVIVAFYTQLSDRLYRYPTPQYISSPGIMENPAWFVSHGYLVFMPDIYFKQGKWGPSTVNTIDGAARYLSQLDYVDSNRMGACGHSNSGRFGYYLLTHTKSFAAMNVGSGTTEVISLALSLTRDSESRLEWAEVDATGSGLGNLWNNKNSWLDHTSVLSADKVSSPLLLFHNNNDDVPVGQAVEMFISLRRLQKKVWWLQYDEGGHVLWELNDLKDYTIRCTQFFDHYLNGAPAPKWMTKGIPAELKGVESRFELDSFGSCSANNDCKTCYKWNEQYKRTPKMFSKPISEWLLDADLGNEFKTKAKITNNNTLK